MQKQANIVSAIGGYIVELIELLQTGQTKIDRCIYTEENLDKALMDVKKFLEG